MPVGYYEDDKGLPRPKAVSQYLLEKYKAAGATKSFFILRNGKWDIPAYYGDGEKVGMDIGYLLLRHVYGVPYTLDAAYPFVKDAIVMLGFPDIMHGPEDCFAQKVSLMQESGADVVLGLFEVEDETAATRSDMVEWDPESGQILDIAIKPLVTDRRTSWITAVWGPRFSAFMHEFLQKDLPERIDNPDMPEIYVGHIIIAVMEAGLTVYGLHFAGEKFLDVGTPHAYQEASRRLG